VIEQSENEDQIIHVQTVQCSMDIAMVTNLWGRIGAIAISPFIQQTGIPKWCMH